MSAVSDRSAAAIRCSSPVGPRSLIEHPPRRSALHPAAILESWLPLYSDMRPLGGATSPRSAREEERCSSVGQGEDQLWLGDDVVGAQWPDGRADREELRRVAAPAVRLGQHLY